jgi:hypothetical protein
MSIKRRNPIAKAADANRDWLLTEPERTPVTQHDGDLFDTILFMKTRDARARIETAIQDGREANTVVQVRDRDQLYALIANVITVGAYIERALDKSRPRGAPKPSEKIEALIVYFKRGAADAAREFVSDIVEYGSGGTSIHIDTNDLSAFSSQKNCLATAQEAFSQISGQPSAPAGVNLGPIQNVDPPQWYDPDAGTRPIFEFTETDVGKLSKVAYSEITDEMLSDIPELNDILALNEEEHDRVGALVVEFRDALLEVLSADMYDAQRACFLFIPTSEPLVDTEPFAMPNDGEFEVVTKLMDATRNADKRFVIVVEVPKEVIDDPDALRGDWAGMAAGAVAELLDMTDPDFDSDVDDLWIEL